jgi:hypothetical protein
MMYDIFFISYNEPNADQNYALLKQRFPLAQRVHGVKGIQQAHIRAATQSLTKMFWVVDGDAVVKDNFQFDYEVPDKDMDAVHVWRSSNPINELEYGYGGVKLLPKRLTMYMDHNRIDMTTSISNRFRAMYDVSNTTVFNTDPFNTWKSAFRESVKLSSKVIDRQQDKETEKRLLIWCTVGDDKPYGEYAIAGALAGRVYGTDNRSNSDALRMINNFEWLRLAFVGQFPHMEKKIL